MSETTPCDSCGNRIVADATRARPRPYEFALPVGDDLGVVESRSFVLCVECRRRIVDWIDDCDESEVRVDMTNLEGTVEGLERHADEISALADELEGLIRE